MAIIYKPYENVVPEGSVDLLGAPWGTPVYWFCPERFLLPVWPEFILSINWGAGCFAEHDDYYVYALEIPLQGNLRLLERDREIVLEPGEAGIIHRGEHSRLEVGPAGFCRKISIGLRGNALTTIMVTGGLADLLSVRLRDPQRLCSRLEKIVMMLTKKNESDIAAISSVALEALNELTLAAASPPEERLATVLNLFILNIPNRITMTELAKRLHISNMTLNRMLRKYIGKSPTAYLRDLKMQTAIELLHQPSIAIQTVAGKVGYDDPLAFSREFKKYTGFSPREYRRTYTAKEQ